MQESTKRRVLIAATSTIFLSIDRCDTGKIEALKPVQQPCKRSKKGKAKKDWE